MKEAIISISMAMLVLVGCSQNAKEQASSDTNNETIAAGVAKNENAPEPKKSMDAMYPELSHYIESIVADLDAIPQERKEQLKKIAVFVQARKQSNEPANLTFICTHNSRRSHLSQIWAATAANYYGVAEGIYTFSAGIETTAFNPRAVAAIERAGFEVENPGGDNPHYQVTFAKNGPAMECFSKKYDDDYNASENFAAIMTCSHADKNCPLILGATLRIPIPYEDPKIADDTEQETAKYDERCKQIATEMFYMMSQV